MVTYILLFLVLLLSLVFEFKGSRISKSYKILLVAILIGISGFRVDVGADYQNYLRIFNYNMAWEHIEYGYRLLVITIQGLRLNAQALIMSTSVLTILPLAVIINKFSPRFFCTGISTYVFTFVFFEGMNTMRQAIAMSLFFVATWFYLYKKKTILYVAICIIASFFHYSVLPVGILGWLYIRFSSEKFNAIAFLIAIIGSFVAGIYLRSFFEQIVYFASFFGYANSASDNFEQQGVKSGIYQYILNAYALFCVLYAYVKRELLDAQEVKIIKLAILAVMIYNLFINFFMGLRFYWYFMLFFIVFLQIVMKHTKKSMRFLFYFLIVSLFIVFTVVSLTGEHYANYKYTFEFFR